MLANFKHIFPSAATLGNLASGILALMFIYAGRSELAALLVIVAMLFDSVDGVLARRLNAESQFGGQLDSLSDMVSFGAVPSLLLIAVLPSRLIFLAWMTGVLYAMSAAIRLARHNTRDFSDIEIQGFVGLPTTGAGGCIATAVILQEMFGMSGSAALFLPVFMISLVSALSLLMVSHIPYLHAGTLMGRNPRTLFIAGTMVLIFTAFKWPYEILFFIFFAFYVISGPLLAAVKIRGRKQAMNG